MSPKCMFLVSFLCLMGIVILLILQLQSRQVFLNYDGSRQQTGGQTSQPTDETSKDVHNADIGTGPLSFVREKGFIDDLANLKLDELSDEQLLMTLHSNLDTVNVLCRRTFRMGNLGDGGWEVCDDPDVRPREPCIIYSFGINNDFSFDDDAAKMYGCHVYSFDPSMTNEKEEFNRSSNVHFYRLGLDGQTHVNANKWALLTFQDIRTKLGHRSYAIDVLKMDIETSEWQALPEMVGSGAMDSVRQFLIEYHVDGQDSGFLLPRLTAIQSLERAGFRKFYSHKNPGCKVAVNGFPLVRTTCYELHYLKRKT